MIRNYITSDWIWFTICFLILGVDFQERNIDILHTLSMDSQWPPEINYLKFMWNCLRSHLETDFLFTRFFYLGLNKYTEVVLGAPSEKSENSAGRRPSIRILDYADIELYLQIRC